MRFSLSGFLFEERYTTQSLRLEEFCSVAAGLGYDGVELRKTQVSPEATRDQRARVRSVVAASGLAVTCLTARGIPASEPERDRALEEYVRLCADLECPLLKVSGEPAWVRAAAEIAAEYGVCLAVNNHVGTQLETVNGTVRYLRETEHRNVGLLFDPFHLYAKGEDCVAAVRRLAPHIRNVLVHSIRPPRSEAERRRSIQVAGRDCLRCMPFDEGAQDWPGVFAALRRVGYDGLVTVIENGWPAVCREEVARENLRYLRKLTERGG